MAVAVRLPPGKALVKRPDWPARPPSHGRVPHAKGRPYRRPKGRYFETRELSYLSPFLRDPPHRERLRHQNGPGAPRPQRREDYHDLHPCPQSRPLRSAKPGGRIVKWIRVLRVSVSCRLSILVINVNRAQRRSKTPVVGKVED